jgi:predicted phosphoadenosine phosphosulfate sulfurtransferase
MKVFKDQNVFDAALERIRFLFDEFPNVVVSYSGGKDSTVIYHLAMIVAKEKNRLPLKVMFIDQEAEWQSTVDLVTEIMENPDVDPYWYQMPMVITNNASSFNRYNHCWNPEEQDKWIHPKHPLSKKENRFKTDRFHDLFAAISKVEFPDQKTCHLAGVRTEESPKRYVGLTERAKYKYITWGSLMDKKKEHFTFYPIYDWSYSDVWKSIHDNGWKYNKTYDEFYRNGVGLNDMRISNLHHETAIQSLMLIQEIEPATWNKVSARIDGANTVKHIKGDSFRCPKDLPPMFESWEEYALYLLENIVQEEKNKDLLLKYIDGKKEIYSGDLIAPIFWRTVIHTILSSDWDLTKLANFEIRQETYTVRQFKKGVYKKGMLQYAKYLSYDEKRILMDKITENANQ